MLSTMSLSRTVNMRKTARASWRRYPSRTLKTLPMNHPARRVDHGSSWPRLYRGARPSAYQCTPLWVRTSVSQSSFAWVCGATRKPGGSTVLLCALRFFVRASAYTFEKTARGLLSHISCCRHIGKFRVEGEVIMKGRNQHITKRSDGNWQVKGEGACRASFVTTTQSEAIKLGRRICSNQESELIIHRRDGRIRARDSHGHDPFPPRG